MKKSIDFCENEEYNLTKVIIIFFTYYELEILNLSRAKPCLFLFSKRCLIIYNN